MISVIVPTHNRRELLEKKLRGLETQKGEFEVIVVADGCTDDTVAFLQTYRPTYPLEVIQTTGLGSAGARNRGAEAAKGETLLFSDDDVMLEAGCIAAHAEAHRNSKQATVFVGKLMLPPQLRGTGATDMLGPRAFWWNLTGNNTSLPKALYRAHGGYDESYQLYQKIQTAEDLDLGYRLMKAGVRFVFLPQAQAIHEAWSYLQGSWIERARVHGESHVVLCKRHGDMRIAWALGVHPTVLTIKMALLPSFKGLLGRRGDYELAHAWGASEAWERKT